MTDDTKVGGYRLIARLGQGGTADVFLAFAEGPRGSGFAKLAVVKRLRRNLAEDPEFISMLMDEGRVTARLSHPNVVQLFEVGNDGDDYFLAMEHLDGQPLHHIERRATKAGKAVAPELYYAVVADTLAGLHHAHELKDFDGTPLGIVHRDVTPHNVFVTYDGNVKVVDFGIAKAVGRITETRQGIVKGKVRYMSPEQAMGGKLDRRTDIFAAGVLLYKAATGKRLWANRDEFEIPQALVRGDYNPSPKAVRPDVPDAIDAICRKALAFRPEDRYATAAEMQAEIEKFLGARNATARRELGAILRELFEAERANLRGVLESSSGNLSASPAVLGLPATGPSSTVLMTVAMPNSKPPSKAAPSIPPLTVAVKPARTVKKERRAPSSRRKPTHRRRSRLGENFWFALLAVVIATLLALAIVRIQAAAQDAAQERSRAVFASDRQSLVREATAHPVRSVMTEVSARPVTKAGRKGSRSSPNRDPWDQPDAQ